jgi:hypothetical protein
MSCFDTFQIVLLKIPSLPGHEYSREISTQTTSETNLIEVSLPNASAATHVSEQLGSLVEACVFTQTDDSLELVDEWRELKGEISTSFIAENKAMGTTDIIVTCHPAALAAITNHNFVATPSAEVAATVSSDDAVLIKPCEVTGEDHSAAVKSESPSDSFTRTETTTAEPVEHQSNTASGYLDSAAETALENVTVTNLKPFLNTNTAEALPNSFGSEQQMESLVLETYEGEDSKDCNGVGDSATSVMHIVVASTACSESTVVDQDGDDEAKKGETDTGTAIFICEVCDKTFRSACSLEAHQNEQHRTRGQCSLCQQVCISVDHLYTFPCLAELHLLCFQCAIHNGDVRFLRFLLP